MYLWGLLSLLYVADWLLHHDLDDLRFASLFGLLVIVAHYVADLDERSRRP